MSLDDPLHPPLPPLLEDSGNRRRFADCGIKAVPEDFLVEELPLYTPCGEGTHQYFWIEKRNLNSLEAVRLLAQRLGLPPGQAGLAGLKDARAVTRQWISFEHVPAARLQEVAPTLPASLGPQLRILQLGRHRNKLKKGHLAGNRFRIRLRTAHAQALQEWAAAALASLWRFGLPNYFGPQRFGRAGGNPHLGRLLVAGDLEGYQTAAAAAGLRGRQAADRRLQKLFVNALQAQLFNRTLALRMPAIAELWDGDLAFLHRNGAVFAVPCAAAEQVRCERLEISPSGPLYGPRLLFAEGRMGELEAQGLAESGLRIEDFGRREAQEQPGARRALRVPLLEEPAAEWAPGQPWVELCFALPAGSYATVLLRELIGDGGLEGPGGIGGLE